MRQSIEAERVISVLWTIEFIADENRFNHPYDVIVIV